MPAFRVLYVPEAQGGLPPGPPCGYWVPASGVRCAPRAVAPQVKPELLWKLYYPVDSYGQFCGRPGSATEQLPVAFYADLDADIEAP